ncbi:MAG: TldD/PmbA family protein [bacterium]|nr:TldD/PmbA family protein [bacterium]
MEYKELAESLVSKCTQKGADAAEVYLQVSRNQNVEIRNGEVETVQESSTSGAGFRVFVQGKMAFAHCNDLSERSLENAIGKAVDFAKHMTSDEYNVLPEDMGISVVEGLFDPAISAVPMDEKINKIVEMERLAMRDNRITKSAGASFGDYEGEIFLANSNGISKTYKSSNCGYYVSVVAEKGDQKTTGGEGCTRRFYTDLKPIEEIAEKAAKDAYEMLDPRMIRTQRASVIFTPDVARTLLGGILGAINGERVLQGASFLKDKIGQKIGDSSLTIIDDGLRSKGLGSKPFDGEGVPTQKRIIVDRGTLQGYMYNTIVAKRAGVESTGNASRGGFTRLPGIGSHNFYMEAGDDDPDSIIRATRRGLFLTSITGYGVNPVSGNFSGGAQGFWIENGRKAFPVKNLTIASTADEIYSGIDRVGNDLDLNLSFTAPTVRIKEMQIGGE